jgi:hypothetical protein
MFLRHDLRVEPAHAEAAESICLRIEVPVGPRHRSRRLLSLPDGEDDLSVLVHYKFRDP